MLKLYDLKCESLSDPVGLDCRHPRFSWKIESDKQGVRQTDYRITVTFDNKTLWDSGTVKSDQSQYVLYKGENLESRMRLVWSVIVTATDKDGLEEQAEGKAFFEIGLNKKDWKAKWIETENKVKPDERKMASYIRKSFYIRKTLKKARIYQSAHGLYEFYINGNLGTKEKFKPGLTSYYHRIQYQTYDITALLQEGENVWAVVLGDGWWRGVTGGTVRNNFGYKLAFFGQIELYYEDGTSEIIATDETFKHSTGGIIASDMQMGEVFDACAEKMGWLMPEYDDGEWNFAHLASENTEGELIGKTSESVFEKEQFTAKSFRDANGDLVLDFGQVIAGYVKMKIRDCKRGQEIKLYYGEDIKDGAFSQDNINSTGLKIPAFQETTYICLGNKEELYCPLFSVFGFRYVKVVGYEKEIQKDDFVAVTVYSDCEITGEFSCSNPLINQLFQNSVWSQKGNFLDVPTDCPTRERNAWTGDAQIYAPTANYIADVQTFFNKWLADMRIEQYASGKVGITAPSTSSVHNEQELKRMQIKAPHYALAGPTGNGSIGEDCAGWGDASAWIPYIVYLFYGDKKALAQQYPMAKKWVEYMLNCAKEKNPFYADQPQYHTYTDGELDANYIYDTRMHYGEWQEPIYPKPDLGDVTVLFSKLLKEGKPKVATAYMCRSSENVAYMAKELGYEEDAMYFSMIAEKIRRVYNKYLIDEDGTIEKGHQAAYVRALTMNLCLEDKREKVLKHLIEEIKSNEYRLNTGFLSTPFLLPVLADNGYPEIAFKILEGTEFPSWLYSVVNGATTITESWDGITEHEGSFNHYSYGAVSEFLFAYVAGIRPDKKVAGFTHFIIKPLVADTMDYADATYESHYGKIRSSWKKENGKVIYRFEIPANTTATIELENGVKQTLGGGRYEFTA